MLVACRRRGTAGQGDGTDVPSALEVEEIGGEGLAAEVVNEGREGAALGDAGQDIKYARAVAIGLHLRARAGEQYINPPPAAQTETVVLKAMLHPRAVHAVIHVLEVEENETHPAAVAGGRLLEPADLFEMEKHVVSEVAARDKGRLGVGQDVVGRAAHAQSEDACDQLVLAVEEGDRAGALAVITWLSTALVQADDEAEALGSGEGGDGGGIPEGLLESSTEDWDEMLLEGAENLYSTLSEPGHLQRGALAMAVKTQSEVRLGRGPRPHVPPSQSISGVAVRRVAWAEGSVGPTAKSAL